MVDNGNGKTNKNEIVKSEQSLDIPEVMRGDDNTNSIISALQNDMRVSSIQNTDLSKYLVMEGMQNDSKISFFTEFINDDDVLRCNTIEQYITVAPLIIRKTSKSAFNKVQVLMQDVYGKHVKTHKRNMVSKQRKRESAYTKILSNDTIDTYATVPTGVKKFFGIGGNSKQK